MDSGGTKLDLKGPLMHLLGPNFLLRGPVFHQKYAGSNKKESFLNILSSFCSKNDRNLDP